MRIDRLNEPHPAQTSTLDAGGTYKHIIIDQKRYVFTLQVLLYLWLNPLFM